MLIQPYELQIHSKKSKMDSLRIHDYKIHAIKKHKRQQFVGTILLYSLSTLACSLLCSSPLWYPSFWANFNAVFFMFIPKICSFFFTSKVLFIVGNLIVIFLVGESKFLASKSKAPLATYSDVCYDKYKCKIPESKVLSPPQVKTLELRIEEKKMDTGIDEDMCKCCRGEVQILQNVKPMDEEVSLPAEDLNKLADDFIARVNRQRRLEAEFFRI